MGYTSYSYNELPSLEAPKNKIKKKKKLELSKTFQDINRVGFIYKILNYPDKITLNQHCFKTFPD